MSTLQSRWALVLKCSHMDADATARHRDSSGLSAVPSAAQPCVSKRDGPPAVREPRRGQAPKDIDGRAWVVRADWAGWMGRTSDARKGIAFPSHQAGAGPAHVEGEWLGRMFRAGRHARYMPWSPEGRVTRYLVTARAGVRGATLGREPPPFTIGIRPELNCFLYSFGKGRGFN